MVAKVSVGLCDTSKEGILAKALTTRVRARAQSKKADIDDWQGLHFGNQGKAILGPPKCATVWEIGI